MKNFFIVLILSISLFSCNNNENKINDSEPKNLNDILIQNIWEITSISSENIEYISGKIFNFIEDGSLEVKFIGEDGDWHSRTGSWHLKPDNKLYIKTESYIEDEGMIIKFSNSKFILRIEKSVGTVDLEFTVKKDEGIPDKEMIGICKETASLDPIFCKSFIHENNKYIVCLANESGIQSNDISFYYEPKINLYILTQKANSWSIERIIKVYHDDDAYCEIGQHSDIVSLSKKKISVLQL